MARPYWTGQISLSQVSFAVEIYPAVTSARPFQFHQIDQATGERNHYQNFSILTQTLKLSSARPQCGTGVPRPHRSVISFNARRKRSTSSTVL